MKRLAATYLGIMGARGIMDTSDTITSSRNMLNNLPGGTAAGTEEALGKVYAAAQRSRGSYTDMLSNVGKTMTLAGDSFGNNIDNAIRFQEIMSKAYTVGGASPAEQTSSMYQLVQALGSGILQGDELRSLREGAPIAYKEIEKFAQGVLNTSDSLKELAADGLITSDIVVAAIMGAEEKINKSFKNTKMTFGQVITSIKNMAIQAFMPVLKTLENALNSSMGQAFIQGIGKALVILADMIIWLMNLLGAFFTWCAENWNWLKYVAIAVISAIIIALGVYTAVMIASAIKSATAWLVVHWQMVLIIAVIAILVAAIVWLANTTKDGCDFMVMALLYVGVAIALIGAITGSTALIIIGLIIVIVSAIIAALDYVMGSLSVAGAFLYNLVVGVIDGIISSMWSQFVEPVAGMIEWFVNAWNGGFTSVGGAFANFCGQLLAGLIGLLKPFAVILDKLFGWDTNGAIESAQANMRGWGKSSSATSFNLEAPTLSSMTGGKLPERIAYGNAWNAGFNLGTEWKGKIGAFGDSIKNKVSNFNLDNKFASPKEFSAGELDGAYKGIDKLGRLGDIDKLNKLADGVGKGSNGLPDPNSPKYALDDAMKKLGNIDDNTGSMADSMELTDEDLEYLRKLATQEWKKEFTTAEVKIDMSNYNSINGDSDLDGIVTRLADKLYDELDAVANGVYA